MERERKHKRTEIKRYGGKKRVEHTPSTKKEFCSFVKLKPYEKREHEKYSIYCFYSLFLHVVGCVCSWQSEKEFELKNRFYVVRWGCVCVLCGQRWRTHKANAVDALFLSFRTLFPIRWEQIRDFSFISLFNNVARIVAFSSHWMAGFIEKRDFMVHFTYYDPLVWSVFALFAVYSFHFISQYVRALFYFLVAHSFFFLSVLIAVNVFGIVLLFYHFECAAVFDSRSSESFINMLLLFAHTDMNVAVCRFKRQQCTKPINCAHFTIKRNKANIVCERQEQFHAQRLNKNVIINGREDCRNCKYINVYLFLCLALCTCKCEQMENEFLQMPSKNYINSCLPQTADTLAKI